MFFYKIMIGCKLEICIFTVVHKSCKYSHEAWKFHINQKLKHLVDREINVILMKLYTINSIMISEYLFLDICIEVA